jgi:hypothetical protein
VSPVATYRHDMRKAWDRISSFPAQRLQTRFGTIEYADQGEGLPLLVSHGVLGCHVDTIDSWWAGLTGPGFRVIGPSRFARRHSQRVIGLILACCRLGGGITLSKAFAPVFRLAYSADPLFWFFKQLMPAAYAQMMGMPKGYQPSPQEQETVTAGLNLLFPLKPRREGAVFDGFVSNLAADRFPLEQLTVPTLVISAEDDTLAPYRFAAQAAGRIPGAKLVTIQGGGHWFLGHDAEVRQAIGEFIHKMLGGQPARASSSRTSGTCG